VVSCSAPPYVDFEVGRWRLGEHFDLLPVGRANEIPYACVLAGADASAFAQQLTGRARSPLPSGRVALFLCGCGDVGCGALTVAVEIDDDAVVWRDFGWEAPYEEGFSQCEVMAQMRPLVFDTSVYVQAFSSFV
jgi:hypothetical protein